MPTSNSLTIDAEVWEGLLATKRFTAERRALFLPTIFIEGADKINERICAIIAETCPPEKGWADVKSSVRDISPEWESYRNERGRKVASGFFVLNVLRFDHDHSGRVQEQSPSIGTTLAETKEEAHLYCKREVIRKLLSNQLWIGGLTQAIQFTLADFCRLERAFWMEQVPPYRIAEIAHSTG